MIYMSPRLIGSLIGLAVFIWLAPTADAVRGNVRPWMSKVYAGDGGDALAAFLDNPGGFDLRNDCSQVIADSQNNVIRWINSSNFTTTLAGSTHYGHDNGPAANATFRNPQEVLIGNSDEVYVADTDNDAIRLIQSGAVSTLLTGQNKPMGLALKNQTLFVSQFRGNKIIAYDLVAKTQTVLATVNAPTKLEVLGNDVYVIYNNGVSLGSLPIGGGGVTQIQTGFTELEGLAGFTGSIFFVTGTNGTTNQIWEYKPGPGTVTQLQNTPETETYNHPSDIDFCGGGMFILFRVGSSIYTAETNGSTPVHRAGVHRWGDRDGHRLSALLGRPWWLARSGSKMYILENHKVKVLDLQTQQLSFLAGSAMDNYINGVGAEARLSGAEQMVLSPDAKTLYFADRNNNRIRKLDIATRRLTTLTGAGKFNIFNHEKHIYAEGGPCETADLNVAGCAYFNRPTGIAISRDGKTLYVADSYNSRVRTVEVATGRTRLLAGSSVGWLDGVGSAAKFRRPTRLLLSPGGTHLYVIDLTNHLIRRIELATKRVVTIMGKGRPGYRDGAWRDAFLSYPDSLAIGPNNTLFLSEVGSQRIRVIDVTNRRISTLTGSGRRGVRNGSAGVASFNNPRGMLLLTPSHLLVTDNLNDQIRDVSLQ